MIFFRACPKCQGEIYVTEDQFGKYRTCMQCGWLQDLEAPINQAVPAGKAPAPVAVEEQFSLAA